MREREFVVCIYTSYLNLYPEFFLLFQMRMFGTLKRASILGCRYLLFSKFESDTHPLRSIATKNKPSIQCFHQSE